jgi:hypothetical protein
VETFFVLFPKYPFIKKIFSGSPNKVTIASEVHQMKNNFIRKSDKFGMWISLPEKYQFVEIPFWGFPYIDPTRVAFKGDKILVGQKE